MHDERSKLVNEYACRVLELLGMGHRLFVPRLLALILGCGSVDPAAPFAMNDGRIKQILDKLNKKRMEVDMDFGKGPGVAGQGGMASNCQRAGLDGILGRNCSLREWIFRFCERFKGTVPKLGIWYLLNLLVQVLVTWRMDTFVPMNHIAPSVSGVDSW
ncbi:hypothetical protein TURU_051380 [Turdus rufiventris]|nr:hypothetical protein TURU_051380 [Turdus rufiventris]